MSFHGHHITKALLLVGSEQDFEKNCVVDFSYPNKVMGKIFFFVKCNLFLEIRRLDKSETLKGIGLNFNFTSS